MKRYRRFQRTAEAWQEAQADLGIDVVNPFHLKTIDGKTFEYAVLIRDFGSAKGLVVLPDCHDREAMQLATSQGYCCSCMNSSYKYKRKVFIDVLDEWGWAGAPSDAPQWCTEKWKSEQPD